MSANATLDYYGALGVEPSATQEEIRKAYYELVKVFHTDKMPTGERVQLRAKRVMQEINEAYEVLGDPVRRAQYDRERKHTKQERQASGGKYGAEGWEESEDRWDQTRDWESAYRAPGGQQGYGRQSSEWAGYGRDTSWSRQGPESAESGPGARARVDETLGGFSRKMEGEMGSYSTKLEGAAGLLEAIIPSIALAAVALGWLLLRILQITVSLMWVLVPVLLWVGYACAMLFLFFVQFTLVFSTCGLYRPGRGGRRKGGSSRRRRR